jgi:hypothetical protein
VSGRRKKKKGQLENVSWEAKGMSPSRGTTRRVAMLRRNAYSNSRLLAIGRASGAKLSKNRNRKWMK